MNVTITNVPIAIYSKIGIYFLNCTMCVVNKITNFTKDFGPLAQETMEELERILNREGAPAELYLRPHRPIAGAS